MLVYLIFLPCFSCNALVVTKLPLLCVQLQYIFIADLLNSRYLLNSMAGASAINPYLMPQFPMLNPYDLSSLPQSSSVNAPNPRSNELRLNTPQLDLTDDLSFNAETVD